MGITAREGAVLQLSVNEAALVPYVANTLRDSTLAAQLAARLNAPEAGGSYMSEFSRMFATLEVAPAARPVWESPSGKQSGRRRGGREIERERDVGGCRQRDAHRDADTIEGREIVGDT